MLQAAMAGTLQEGTTRGRCMPLLPLTNYGSTAGTHSTPAGWHQQGSLFERTCAQVCMLSIMRIPSISSQTMVNLFHQSIVTELTQSLSDHK